MRTSLFLIPVGYEYLMVFCFQYGLGLYTMQEPSYLNKITLLYMWYRMVVTQIITWVYKDSHLDIPTKYQNLTSVTILLPTERFFVIITDVSFIRRDSVLIHPFITKITRCPLVMLSKENHPLQHNRCRMSNFFLYMEGWAYLKNQIVAKELAHCHGLALRNIAATAR